MIPALKAEFRKLLTVRSTYVIAILCVLITVFFAFYVEGYKQDVDIKSPTYLASQLTSAPVALSLFIAIAGVLLFTHEYRYNTIMYTLTAARSRTQVLIAKVIVISVFSILLTLLVSSLSPYLTHLGLQAKGLSLVPQDFPVRELLVRSVIYGWGYSMFALLIAGVIRIQVGAIAALFLLPGPAEGLLGLLLKSNAKYLPFSTLNAILSDAHNYSNKFLVLAAYLVGGWIIAWLLFLRRDAA